MPRFKYKAYGQTNRGTRHYVNEDSFTYKAAIYNKEPILFALVADGMGGTSEGEAASSMIKDAFENWFEEDFEHILSDCEDYSKSLAHSWQTIIEQVNRQLNNRPVCFDEYGDPKKRPGTTLVMILLHNGIYYTANIGDSRIYKGEKGSLYHITKDHSWVQRELDKGASLEELKDSPNINALTRCIGAELTDCPDVEYHSDEYGDGDVFLLCSDGFWHTNQANSKIEDILTDEDLNTKEAIQEFIHYAREREEDDDITAVLIKVISTQKGQKEIATRTEKLILKNEEINRKE